MRKKKAKKVQRRTKPEQSSPLTEDQKRLNQLEVENMYLLKEIGSLKDVILQFKDLL